MRLIGSARSILRRSTRTRPERQSSSATSVAVTEPNNEPVGPAFTSKRSSVCSSTSATSRACSRRRPAAGGAGRPRSCAGSGSCPFPRCSGGAGCSSCSPPLRPSRGRRSSCAAGRRILSSGCVCPAAAADLAAVPSERDVVVGAAGAEVALLCRGAGLDELRLGLGVAAAAEELDRIGDDLDGLALRAVLRLPLAPLQAPVDPHRASLGEVLRAVLPLVTPDGDVEVVGLLAPFAGRRVLAPRVDGQAQAANGCPARRVPQLGVARQVSDEDDAVDVGCHLVLPS